MGHSFDMLTFDFLLKPPQPVTGLFLNFQMTFVVFVVTHVKFMTSSRMIIDMAKIFLYVHGTNSIIVYLRCCYFKSTKIFLS